ncbi:hypothetical protein ACFFK0_11845 [Paenibacillus chartarius]|uniref:Uncharacterized protein n=1 Tax=Paenibacillus chartarius TaxID=747481 RepID=A0ABV6DKJ5_9BACL
MTERKPKGLVEFRQPPAKLVADIPGDEEMREHLEETMHGDGYPGACGVIDVSRPSSEHDS